MEALLKIWDQLDARYGPWRALLLIVAASTCAVFITWLTQKLVGVPIVPIVINRITEKTPPSSGK